MRAQTNVILAGKCGSRRQSSTSFIKCSETTRLLERHLPWKLPRLCTQKIETRESSIVLFFRTKVSTLISVEGDKALFRSLNDKKLLTFDNLFPPIGFTWTFSLLNKGNKYLDQTHGLQISSSQSS